MKLTLSEKILTAVCKNEKLYIKNTGVEILVISFGDNTKIYNKSDKMTNCFKIEFLTIPTKKALALCKNIEFALNRSTGKIEGEALIPMSDVSLTPYEGKAAKILYEKTKKRK